MTSFPLVFWVTVAESEAVPTALGVPEIRPEELKLSPAGRLPVRA
jgi:hypothetical protein